MLRYDWIDWVDINITLKILANLDYTKGLEKFQPFGLPKWLEFFIFIIFGYYH
jgi:hypothetical protein